MNRDSKIYVAGHRGLVGRAIFRYLKEAGYENLLTANRSELDLRRQAEVEEYFDAHKPEIVFLAAAEVGGIGGNVAYPADFIRNNLQIQTNAIDSAYRSGASKFVFLGSSCIYPKFADQPIHEDSLLTGSLEPTNRAYAVAKIAGIEMCRAYRQQYGFDAISLMPTNLYGPGDNFDLENSHVLPALIRKFHSAVSEGSASVEIWGSGEARREFLHVDDLASACEFLARKYADSAPINVGVGKDISIAELASLVGEVSGFEGELVYDRSKPDGTPRKLLDTSKLADLGWQATIPLADGIKQTYDWYAQSVADHSPTLRQG